MTPLQMSNYAAALSDAGTVWRPRVVLRLQTPEGTTVKSFAASSAGHASVRPQDLQVILGAMRRVVADPIGTLYLGFRGTPVQFFGKSGTAETTSGAPDIWFIGGASLDSPTLVVAAVVEEKPNGLHSLDAASIGRHVIEASLQ